MTEADWESRPTVGRTVGRIADIANVKYPTLTENVIPASPDRMCNRSAANLRC